MPLLLEANFLHFCSSQVKKQKQKPQDKFTVHPPLLFLPITQPIDMGGSLTLRNVIRVPLVHSELYK